MNDIVLIFILISVSIIQSIYGVGVLVFGTPLLLIYGLEFLEALNVLLPISFCISFIQVQNHKNLIEKKLAYNLLYYALPTILITLSFIANVKINLNLIIALILIFSALSNQFSFNLNKYINDRINIFFIAFFHGLSNLGGSLLTAYISNKKWDKLKTRTNISFSYMFLAVFQMITLAINGKLMIGIYNFNYIILCILTFFITDKFIFKSIDNEKYRSLIVYLLYSIAITLIYLYFSA
jgi:uncharacterized protein